LLAPAAALAAKEAGPKARTMAKYDLNHDGKLDGDEVTAIQKDFAAAPTGELSRLDTNKDGKLSAEEVAMIIPGSGKKSDRKKHKELKEKDAAPQSTTSSETK
jgi:Ca2+-binding EF-hand superfamily protein